MKIGHFGQSAENQTRLTVIVTLTIARAHLTTFTCKMTLTLGLTWISRNFSVLDRLWSVNPSSRGFVDMKLPRSSTNCGDGNKSTSIPMKKSGKFNPISDCFWGSLAALVMPHYGENYLGTRRFFLHYEMDMLNRHFLRWKSAWERSFFLSLLISQYSLHLQYLEVF